MGVGSDTTTLNQLDEQGRRTGPWRVEYPNGKVRYEATFRAGRPVGEMVRYYENGAVQARMDFDSTADRSYTRLYYDNGKKAAEGWYVEREKDSVWTYYSEFDGTVRIREPYNQGALQGQVRNYFPSGEVSEEVAWDRHQKEGDWKQYYSDGALRLESNYHDNQLQGPYRVYYPDSTVKVRGTYEENLAEGTWEFFDASGNLLYTIEYEHGRPVDQEEYMKMMQDSMLRFQEIQDSLLQLEEAENPDAFRPF
jgi:antitoxin component YwqK of YwqJK toxin-antitoxin module